MQRLQHGFLAYWYHIGAVVGALALVYLGVFWQDFTLLERLLLANFAIMCLHWLRSLASPVASRISITTFV